MLKDNSYFVRHNAKRSGFTLIELMIAVAVIGILAAIALPSYNSQIRKSRRADAVASISAVQQAEERWRANNTTYTTNLTTASPSGLGLSSTSAGGYYTLSLSATVLASTPLSTVPLSTSYTITATAVSGKSQANDTNCTTLTSTITNGAGTNTPTACWSR
jgi:type IV pilus assembly protein PilE